MPIAGGQAVYIARGLLRVLNDSIEYFDDIVCLQAGYYRAKSDEVKINPGIRIIPNPANSIIEIYSYKVNDNGGEIRIYNSIGECVYLAKTEIGVKLKSISTTNLSPGVYTVNTSFGECIYTDKLIIIR
jgi:hypothetical protein